jgi:hypothetical protein
VTTDLDDPFASVATVQRTAERKKIISGGRYRLPRLDGSHKTYGWQRVTNLVSAFADQFGLRMWEFEQMMTAIMVDRDRVLADLVSTMEEVQFLDKVGKRSAIEAFVDRCKAISGGDEGTRFGNHRHALVEADHLALPQGATDAFARQHLSLYRSALVRHKLTAVEGMQERRVLVEELEAIGTLDNILRDAEELLFVGDLKTQKRFWTWLEIAAQEACYAHAIAMWESANDATNPVAGRWVDMPKVSQDVGLVLWMPREHPSGEPAVDVYEVDLKAGWETAKLARQIVVDRAGGKRKTAPRAWLRQAPPATLVEQYAARFAAVDSIEEGSRLVAECIAKKVWCDVLADEAKAAKVRVLAA